MMSKNSNTRSRETEGVPCLKRTLIGKQNKIHVVIRRRNISSPGPPGQLERSIDDPKLISPLVHLWQDWQHTRRSIFDRKGIVVNQPEHLDQERSRPTRSKTPSRSKSPASYRSRKSSARNKSNSPRERSNSSRERSNSPRTRNNSPNEKGKERSPYRRKSLDRRRSSERNRRSKSLDMRKSVENYRERRSGSRERTTGSAGKKKEKYSEHKCFRKKSISPLRPGEYIPFHPDLKKRNRSREERKDNIRESRSSRESSNSPRSRSYSMRQRSNCPREKSTGRRSLLGRNSPDRRRRSSEKVRRSRSLDIRKSVENLRERRSGSREGITGNAGRKNEKDYKKTMLKNKIISPLRPGEYIQFHPDLEKHYRSREERNDNFRWVNIHFE
nr:serine/arginine repetitive matrix protein 2-like [Leptinotarsa decemlineata]